MEIEYYSRDFVCVNGHLLFPQAAINLFPEYEQEIRDFCAHYCVRLNEELIPLRERWLGEISSPAARSYLQGSGCIDEHLSPESVR